MAHGSRVPLVAKIGIVSMINGNAAAAWRPSMVPGLDDLTRSFCRSRLPLRSTRRDDEVLPDSTCGYDLEDRSTVQTQFYELRTVDDVSIG